MTLELSDAVLKAYSLQDSEVEPLGGGVINRVWKVGKGSDAYVLKQYTGDVPSEQVHQSIKILNVAGARGLPVPAVLPDRHGEIVSEMPEGIFVLFEYVRGKLLLPDEIPVDAARSMGATLGELHAVLAEVPAGEMRPLPRSQDIEAQLRGLLTVARSRAGESVDDVAADVLEAKLELLSKIESVPDFAPQWTHGDYEWRNVLFDEADEVAAIIDFDDVQFFSPSRDVMRCIALSFPSLGPEVDDFFGGYAAVVQLTPEEARSFVEFYRYISTYRVWPIINRYRHPERYRPEWDALIQPLPAWDWEGLSERLAEIAANPHVGGTDAHS